MPVTHVADAAKWPGSLCPHASALRKQMYYLIIMDNSSYRMAAFPVKNRIDNYTIQ